LIAIYPQSRIFVALFCVVLGGYALLSPAHFLTSPDEEINLRTTLSFLQGYGGAIPPLEGFASKTGRNGNEYAQYGLGLPLASLPWCALGIAIDPSPKSEEINALNRYFGDRITRARVGTDFLRGWMSGFNMLISAVTVALVFSTVLRLGLSTQNALLISFLLAFGCYTWPHGRTFFTEPFAAFCLISALRCFIQSRESGRRAFWTLSAGIFWAYAVLTRMDSLVTVPAAAWLLLSDVHEGKIQFRFSIKQIVLFAIPWILVFAAIFFYNEYRFGSIVSTGYEDQPEKIRFITPFLVGLHGFLFTPGRSVFLYSPPLILALLGINRFWKKDAWLAGSVFLLIVGYLGAMSKWQNWAGGYDWGPRHVYQITPFLAIVAAAWMGDRNLFDLSAKRIGWAVMAIIAAFIQILGLSADSILMIQRFLHKMAVAMPAEVANAINPYLLQFPVYLPQFSSPALHWQWMMEQGADLLILKTDLPSHRVLFLIPLGLMGWGMYRIWRYLKSDSGVSPVE